MSDNKKHDSQPLHLGLAAELRLNLQGQDLAGARQLALLAEIARLGSLTHAAKAVGYSYKGAWNAIEQMSNLAGEPLLDRVAGGKGGGFTRLTERGAQLLRNYELIQQEHARFVARLNRQSQGLSADYALMGSIAMKTSARNQFAGTISALRTGAVNDEIELSIIGGQTLVATVTRESSQELALAIGAKAFALVKASSVLLVAGAEAGPGGLRLSARNQLRGVVSRLVEGAVNNEVVLSLPGGGTVAAIVSQAGAEALGLAVGLEAVAVFNASSVILGVST
ncbi:molybdate transport system regulatory protein [Paucibacter oligotrophus]|uniref:Molybdate transport system regulatory protein n=1 Tax=Roseateles oligotrophus TaxID=1769250 RepID=A0A840LBZ4_9BURK|nr:TOBE domain-containing protein [Roseateles oligotrophus]MBB4845676.1 molybdate transport system regulatory protein [Roseateles oligotrophus]